MKQIKELNLYVGTKEEYQQAIANNMKIVCALNRATNYVTHQSVVGWIGKGCNKDNPYYLYKIEDDAIYLNMIDVNDERYINSQMINAALDFIKDKLDHENKVFIYCSLGESRSPSLALMYLLENDLIEKHKNVFGVFKEYYEIYNPKKGYINYIKNRWLN